MFPQEALIGSFIVIEAPRCREAFLHLVANLRLPSVHAFEFQPDTRAILPQNIFHIPETIIYESSYGMWRYLKAKFLLRGLPNIRDIFDGQTTSYIQKSFGVDSHADSERLLDLREYFGSQSGIADTDTDRYANFLEYFCLKESSEIMLRNPLVLCDARHIYPIFIDTELLDTIAPL